MSIHPLLTRRRLLQQGAVGTGAAAALALLPRPLTAMLSGPRPEPIPSIQDDRIKALVQRGLDAAKSAGATYADIRMTHTRTNGYTAGLGNPGQQDEALHVGVRAIVNGYWGFATSPIWSPEELARLGTAATRQAKENALGKPRELLLPPAVVVRDGHWETPIQIDPLLLHPDDIGDYIGSVSESVRSLMSRLDNRYGDDPPNLSMVIGYFVVVQSKAFGSTDGSYCTQRLYRSDGIAKVSTSGTTTPQSGDASDLLTPTAAGWELFRNRPIVETIRQSILHNQAMARLPAKPLDVGRYTTMLDAKSVAYCLSQTIGAATQLDRSLGYEANAEGTSYLVDPDTMLGSYTVGGPTLTVHANRNEAGGIATTAWDDEGVVPATFPLIERGVLTEFLTSREGAEWLKPRTDQLQRPFRSNGCMYSQTANDAPTIHTPNLVMRHDAAGGSANDLEAGVDTGMLIVGMRPQMDFQLLNGYAHYFSCYELSKGKRVARILGAGILFRTPEIWKSILAVGGATSAQRVGLTAEKGQPTVEGYHSVTAVPMTIKDLTYIDPTHR